MEGNEKTFNNFMQLKMIQLFILSSIVNKIKKNDLKKEKAEIENHQVAMQRILNELISYISNENTIDITFQDKRIERCMIFLFKKIMSLKSLH